MGAKKSCTHKVMVTVRTNKPVYRWQAIYAAWNHITDTEIYGMGVDHATEPYDEGKITVPRSQ